MTPSRQRTAERPDPRRLHRQLILVMVVYFFAGAASQKLIPGVDEIFPFFGWSLFSKVPNLTDRYVVLLEEHEGSAVTPPAELVRAPEALVRGNRYIARKVVQRLGRAVERGQTEEVVELRRLLEENYLTGRTRYELVFERYFPLEKWRSGENREQRSLGRFESGRPGPLEETP